MKTTDKTTKRLRSNSERAWFERVVKPQLDDLKVHTPIESPTKRQCSDDTESPFISQRKVARIGREKALKMDRRKRGRLSLPDEEDAQLDPCTQKFVNLGNVDALFSGVEGSTCVVVDIRVPEKDSERPKDTFMLEETDEDMPEAILNEFKEAWRMIHETDVEKVLCRCVCEYENGKERTADIIFKIVDASHNNITHYLTKHWMILTGPPRFDGTFFKTLSDTFMPLAL